MKWDKLLNWFEDSTTVHTLVAAGASSIARTASSGRIHSIFCLMYQMMVCKRVWGAIYMLRKTRLLAVKVAPGSTTESLLLNF
jgi:hypothetical protein